MYRKWIVLLLLVVTVPVACKSSRPPARVETWVELPRVEDAEPRDYPGIHNAVAFHDGYISGAVPEGDAGFDTLRAMGVKTIISVDGMLPDVKAAEARGIRYIHLPIGYSGFDAQRRDQLVRATRDALEQGPVYIHCHHGKHRSAGAAGTVAVSLGWMTNDQAVARMKVSGTSPKYRGLYACAANAEVMDRSAVDAVSADFPSSWKPSDFVTAMVEIDAANDHLKAIQKAGWSVPGDHPDLVPVAEAGRLADLYRTSHADEYTEARPAEFAAMMRKAHEEAQQLERLLDQTPLDPAKLDATFKLVAASCTDCHAKYRDN